MQTHITNPLLTANTINNAIEKYFSIEQQYDSIFSVTKIQARFFTSDVQRKTIPVVSKQVMIKISSQGCIVQGHMPLE